MDWPVDRGTFHPHTQVTNWGVHSLGGCHRPGTMAGIGSAAWPTANLGYFFPVRVGDVFAAQRMYWINGTAVAGNVDAGIYNAQGTKLASIGSTAQSGTTAIQSAALTAAVTLPPGWYYLALVSSSTSAQFHRANTVNTALLYTQMASALPLPTTLTPAFLGSGYYPLVGMSARSLP